MSFGNESDESSENLSGDGSPIVLQVKKRKLVDPIWEKFEEITQNQISLLKCKSCDQKYKSSSATSTTLKYHWKAKHHIQEDETCSKNHSGDVKKLTRIGKIELAFTNVLAIPSISINSFLHPAIRRFVDLLNRNFKLPKSHTTLKSRLEKRATAVKNNLKQELGDLKLKPSVTVDIWTDEAMRNSYLGITLHYINCGKLCRAFLGLRKLRGSHTSSYIRTELGAVLAEYNMDLHSIFKIVTDNGSNMVAAFTDVFKLNNEFDDEPEDEENDSFLDETFPDIPDVTLENFPHRISCHAHSLQIVIMGLIKNNIYGHSAFKNMCQLIRRFRHSNQALEDLDSIAHKRLIFPSATRWGSAIEVIKNFLELEEYVIVIASRKNWSMVTEDEIEYLRWISKIGGPFVEVLQRIQGEKTVTISHCLEHTRALVLSLDDLEEVVPNELKLTVQNLRGSLKERFTNILNTDRTDFDPIFMVACALDPNTSDCLGDEDLSKAAERIRQLLPAEQTHRRNDNMGVSVNLDSRLDGFIARLKKDSQSSRKSVESRGNRSKSWILNVLHSVQGVCNGNLKIDPINYWCGYLSSDWHYLAVLALEVLSVPATSAPVERIFSQAGLATRSHRNRTEFSLLNSQLLVYCNRGI